ncbi:hypothetical protein PoB_001355300 [Plakobranchus ocellatus]|uniref:Uncharacterized protein n=1 Tax=Plakobranchus ocellatus TaxID=259542 RepID=A0AAV3YWY1_9GAST|nr:hypothetical protein PoB_001355300 [Plakobranchus ocellatus]
MAVYFHKFVFVCSHLEVLPNGVLFLFFSTEKMAVVIMLQHLPQVLLFESSFFPPAHWIEEKQTEEKRIDNTQKQAETFGVTQAHAHKDKWSRLENSSSTLCPADF